MVVGAQGRGAHPIEEVSETSPGLQDRAEGQSVHEAADDPFDLDVVAVGDRSAHAEVGGTGPAVKDSLPAGEEGHEEGGPPAAAGSAQVVHTAGRGTAD